MRLRDTHEVGYLPLRDERPGLDPADRSTLSGYTVGSVDRTKPAPKDASTGDVQPPLLWPNDLTKRTIPSYGHAWAATVTASDKDPKPASNRPAPGFAQFATPGGGNPFGGFFGAQPNQRPGGIGVPGAFGGFFGTNSGQLGGIGVPGAFAGITGVPAGGVTQGGQIGSTQVGAGSKPNPKQTTTGATGGAQQMHLRPIRDRGTVEDDRYEHIVAPDRPSWSSRFPKGWTGAMLCTSREERQDEVFIPGAHALVAASDPDADPLLTTAVVGTDPKTDRVDPERRATLNGFLRVIKSPFSPPWNALSWNMSIGDAAKAHDTSAALGYRGFVTDDDPGDGLSTTIRGAAPPLVHGLMSARMGGPLDVGPSAGRHRISADGDGFTINPAALSTHLLWRVPGSGTLYGPMIMAARAFDTSERSAPNVMRAHIVWKSDEPAPGRPAQRGAFVIQAETAIETEGGSPPPDIPDDPRIPTPGGTGGGTPPPSGGAGQNPHPNPGEPGGHPAPGVPKGPGGPFGVPKPNPKRKRPTNPDALIDLIEGAGTTTGPTRQKPRVGPTRLETRDKAIATTGMELAAPTFLLRPAGWGCGTEDVRNNLLPSPEARDRRKRDPIIGALHTAWKKPGGACNPWGPQYTTRPGFGPYPGGTANGIAAWLPPEVTFADHPTSYAPGGVTKSSLVMGALKGSVLWGSGIPNPTTALLESGYTWGVNATTGAMEFHERSSTGAIASTNTLPKRTGIVTLGDGSTSSGEIPEGNADGDLTGSGLLTSNVARLSGTTTDFASATWVRLNKEAHYVDTLSLSNGGATNWDDAVDGRILFVSAGSLTTTHTITLPNPADLAGRVLTIKIIAVAGSGTLDLDSEGGANVEGVATYSADATARTTLRLATDGSNWWLT